MRVSGEFKKGSWNISGKCPKKILRVPGGSTVHLERFKDGSRRVQRVSGGFRRVIGSFRKFLGFMMISRAMQENEV